MATRNVRSAKFLSTAFAACAILWAGTGIRAAELADYDYSSPAGTSPTTQGWTELDGSTNAFVGGIDAGTGWRIVDGSTTAGTTAIYQRTLADPMVLDAGWELTWTGSMDSDAYNVSTGATVDNYYLPPNQARQSNNGVWMERAGAGGYLYWLTYGADADGNLTLSDGTTTHTLTTAGGNVGYDTFHTFTLRYDGAAATLTMDGSSPISIASRTPTGQNRVLFGASTSAGQGSVVYRDVTLTAVPEPTSLGLLGLAGVALLRRRRL